MLKGRSFTLTLTLLALSASRVFLPAFSQQAHAQQVVLDKTEASIEVPSGLNDTIVRLAGWHARALENPYPSPHLFNWTITRDQFDIFASSSSMAYPNKLTVAFLRDNDNRSVVIDSMGRILLPVEEDYTRMVELARFIVRREFYDGESEEDSDDDDLTFEELAVLLDMLAKRPARKQTYQQWTIDRHGASCQPGDNWSIRVPDATTGEEEWKGHHVGGYNGPWEDPPLKLVRPVNGHNEIPLVLYQFMALTYEGVEWSNLAEGQEDIVRRATIAFSGWY